MKSGSFICTVVNRKLKIYDLKGFNEVVAAYGDGEDLSLAIHPVGRVRTQAQNRFFHGPILRAFQTLGYHQQECKEMLCLRFIPQEIRRLDGTTVLVPGHTSDLTVEQFNDFIDSVIELAAELDIIIEDAAAWRQLRRRTGVA
jgi:hypothetical protein